MVLELITYSPERETKIHTTTESQQTQLSVSQPIAAQNSSLAYGLGSFGLESLYNVFAGFYMFYYIDELGLAVALAAIINIIYGIWDAVDDPLVGFLSDNTRTHWGRRRPWLLTGLPFYVGILVLVYAVPEPFLQGNALFWYALVVFLLFETAYTVISVNYKALFPELFQGLGERARASSTYGGLSMLGELVGFSIPPFIYARFGFVPMAISFAGVAGIVLFLGIIRNQEDSTALQAPPLDLKDSFGEVLKDRPFLLFIIAVTFLMFAMGVYTLAIPFWVKYTLAASPQVTSLVFALAFSVAILSAPLWGRLVRILGLKRSWLWSVGLGAASPVIMGLASNLIVGAIGAAFVGLSMGGINVCRVIIMANFVDRNLERTGHRREGIYFSLLRIIGTLSKIPQALTLALLGVFFGYVSGENPGPQPDNAFRFLISVFPFVFAIIAWLIASRLSFETKEAETGTG
jgi:GPH family glycoside/pentoside/hexuronide:cation symporter